MLLKLLRRSARSHREGGEPEKPPPNARTIRRALKPYLFLAPALLFLGTFIYWPVAQVGFLSVFEWNLVSPRRDFVGLENFTGLLADVGFYQVLTQSLFYILIALVGNFLLPVGLAMLTLVVSERSSGLYQSLLFTPTVVAVSVGALVWQYIYLPNGGLLNAALGAVGLPGGNWLNDPDTALGSIGVIAAWKFMGFNYLIALAGLLAVPREYLEAAQVDGASGWPLLRWVLIPLLMPTILFVMLTTILQALPNAFVPIEILTRGGPSSTSNNLIYSIYEDGFRFFQVGKSSALAVITMMLLGAAAIWQFRILDRSLSYDR